MLALAPPFSTGSRSLRPRGKRLRRLTPPHSFSPGRSRPPSGPRGSSCSSASTAGTCLKHPAAAAWRQEPDTNYRNRVERPSDRLFLRCAAQLRRDALLPGYPGPASLAASGDFRCGRARHQPERVPIHFIADLLVPLGDLLDWQLPWSRQHTMPMCPATPWGPSPANLVVANRPRGLTRDTGDVLNCE